MNLRIIDINPVVVKFTRLTREVLVGSNVTELVRSEKQETGFFSTLQQTDTFNSRPGFRLRTDNPDLWIPVSVTMSRMHFSDSPPLGLVMLHDMREINEAKRRADRTSAELKRVLQSVNDCVWNAIIDRTGEWQYVYLSPVIERITGHHVERFLEQPTAYRENVHADDRRVYDDFVANLHGGRSDQVEYRVCRADGTICWVDERVNCTQLHGAVETCLFGLLTDITDRKRNEERLRQMEAELAHFSRISAMGEMAAAIAHEVNQPLHAIANFASAAEEVLETDDGSSANLRNLNRRITEQAIRAGEIIRRLRGFVSKSNGSRSIVDANVVVRDSIQLLAPASRDCGVLLRLDLTESPLHVNADQVQCQQVIVNLLQNAFESMLNRDASERVATVETSIVGSEAQVSIKDTGVGISEDSLDKLLTRSSQPSKPEWGSVLCHERTVRAVQRTASGSSGVW